MSQDRVSSRVVLARVRRGRRTALLGLLAAAAAVGAVPESAGAHAAFVGAEPAAGGRIEGTPREVALSFTEPLNGRLSRIEVVAASSGRPVRTTAVATARSRLSVRPSTALADGPYVVRWFTVSTEDGHALEGTFSFGVRAPAAAVRQSVEQSPLARGGWVRILLRVILYVTVLLFVAAILLPRLMRGGLVWLVPAALGETPDLRARRVRASSLTGDVGWLAVGAAAGATLAEAADAAGSFSPSALSDFLLVGAAGWARLAVLVLVTAAVLLHARRARLAAVLGVLALGGIAASGHASAASPRVPSVLNDWLHLTSGAAWLGGIGLIGLVWGRALRRAGPARRRDVARLVLLPFGRVALPAFLVVTATGLVSLLTQLGALSALWQTAYGRLLAVKIAVVALIAAASALHAWRLRPALLHAEADGPEARRERRHWRLVCSEPVLGLLVIAIVGALVAFPLPPRQLDAVAAVRAATPSCDPCPLPKPSREELPVATRAGTLLVAGWIRRSPGAITGTVRISDRRGRPSRVAADIDGAATTPCGEGCRRFRAPATGSSLRVGLLDRGSRYVAELPTRWDATGNRRARRLLADAEAAMRRVRSVRQIEEVTSGPGSFARTTYRLQAPDRMTFRTDRGVQTVVIGRRQWYRTRPGPYTVSEYGAGLPFLTRSWFRWSVFGRSVRLLGVEGSGARRRAELALFDEATPAWIRLTVDLATQRVIDEESWSKSHTTRSRYRTFDRTPPIATPEDLVRGR